MKIFIKWDTVRTEEDFYSQLLPQLKAPDFHGHSLDALRDSIITGGINGIEPPYCVIHSGVKNLSPLLQDFYDAIISILTEAKNTGRTVRIFQE